MAPVPMRLVIADSVNQFIETHCTIGNGDTVSVASVDLYEAYIAWCDGNARRKPTFALFGRVIGARFSRAICSGRRHYLGIALSSPDRAHKNRAAPSLAA